MLAKPAALQFFILFSRLDLYSVFLFISFRTDDFLELLAGSMQFKSLEDEVVQRQEE